MFKTAQFHIIFLYLSQNYNKEDLAIILNMWIEASVSKGRDVPGPTGTGRPVVPFSRDKNKFLSRGPVVPGQGQEQMSQDKTI